MLDIQYIYNITKTTVPTSKEVLIDCINNAPTFGYIFCTYSELISKITEINSVTEISVTKNPEQIYQLTSMDVEAIPEVVFKVEGLKVDNDAYLNTVIRNNDTENWTDFSTYSKEFRQAILHIKELCFKKFLWNYENIHNWFLSGDIQLGTDSETQLSNDWESFKTDVIGTEDLSSFISSCAETDKQNYISTLRRNTQKIITRFKSEFMTHVDYADVVTETLTLHNPVISKIFVLSSKYSQCKKEFPMLNVISISQRNFGLIGIMN